MMIRIMISRQLSDVHVAWNLYISTFLVETSPFMIIALHTFVGHSTGLKLYVPSLFSRCFFHLLASSAALGRRGGGGGGFVRIIYSLLNSSCSLFN